MQTSEPYEHGLPLTGTTGPAPRAMFFVPATREEALFVSRAALWDVRNEFLYMTAESESVQGQRRPLVFIDRKEVIDDARKDSLGQLIQEVSKRMSSLAAGG